ncbi:hypothetical protein BG004_002299, partial [Podila humilis]
RPGMLFFIQRWRSYLSDEYCIKFIRTLQPGNGKRDADHRVSASYIQDHANKFPELFALTKIYISTSWIRVRGTNLSTRSFLKGNVELNGWLKDARKRSDVDDDGTYEYYCGRK